MNNALIVWGGWDGHEPEPVSMVFKEVLEAENFTVEVSNTLESFEDVEKLKALDLIVPVWTMGDVHPKTPQNDAVRAIMAAVATGVGLAGCHGGMCDAFRQSTEWQFMTGGNWVAHPGGDGVEYEVNICNSSSGLMDGLSDFKVTSEQYYLHVDPAVEVLATTRFPVENWYHSPNKKVDMPVVWTKRWGLGRVYYNSLGHHADIFDMETPKEMMRRGFLWATEGKADAKAKGLTADMFESKAKMF